MQESVVMKRNKEYPAELEKAVLKSLSFYPDLAGTEIRFSYAGGLKSSVMQAQPLLKGVFRQAPGRSYVIKIARQLAAGSDLREVRELPFEVLVGWLGHELGHIMDYLHRSRTSLLGFGFGYVFSKRFRKGAERRADEIAVRHGMGSYIQAAKSFILNHSGFSPRYKEKIRRLYLSPEEIAEMIQESE